MEEREFWFLDISVKNIKKFQLSYKTLSNSTILIRNMKWNEFQLNGILPKKKRVTFEFHECWVTIMFLLLFKLINTDSEHIRGYKNGEDDNWGRWMKKNPAFDERIRTWLSQNGGLLRSIKVVNYWCIMDF